MDKYKDPLEELIREDLKREAEAIDREVEAAGIEDMSDELKQEMKERLYKRIEQYEKERTYAKLSAEDQEALRLGKEILKSREEENKEKVVYRRKWKRMYVAVAAVAILVLALGITSIGGAERIVEMMQVLTGTREIIRVDTEDNLVLKNEDEEETYQQLKEVFGVEIVRIVYLQRDMKFVSAEIDYNLQNAVLLYECGENTVRYYMSSHNTGSSWGRYVEDELTDQYEIAREEMSIEVDEYATPETDTKYYTAHFTYRELEYYLIGTLEREDFDFLVKNLIFF